MLFIDKTAHNRQTERETIKGAADHSFNQSNRIHPNPQLLSSTALPIRHTRALRCRLLPPVIDTLGGAGIMAVRLGLLLLLVLSSTWNTDARQLGNSDAGQLSVLHSEGVPKNERVCALCEEFAAQALDYLSDNKTQGEVLTVLHESCSRVPTFQQQCNTLVDYYAPLFFLEVSSVQPGDFCQKVNLCEQMALLSAQVKEDSCEICHHAVSEALEKLKDPDTQMDIIEALMKACNSVEKKYVKKCKRMVFEYGPLFLSNAEQFLETRDLCTALHACKSSVGSSNQEASSEVTAGHSES